VLLSTPFTLNHFCGFTFRSLKATHSRTYLPPLHDGEYSGKGGISSRAFPFSKEDRIVLSQLQRQARAQTQPVLQANPQWTPQPLRRHGWRVHGNLSLPVHSSMTVRVSPANLNVTGSLPLQAPRLQTPHKLRPDHRVQTFPRAQILHNSYTLACVSASRWLSMHGFSIEYRVACSILL
jgi:hypothetical protein